MSKSEIQTLTIFTNATTFTENGICVRTNKMKLYLQKHVVSAVSTIL